MRTFRAFLLDSSGKIVDARSLQCETVDQAVAQAKKLAVNYAVELWEPPVRVGLFEPIKVNLLNK